MKIILFEICANNNYRVSSMKRLIMVLLVIIFLIKPGVDLLRNFQKYRGNKVSIFWDKNYQKIKDQYRVKLIRGTKKGVYANHNLLFKNAKGTHIRVIDDDHIIPQNHIYKSLKFIIINLDSNVSISKQIKLTKLPDTLSGWAMCKLMLKRLNTD